MNKTKYLIWILLCITGIIIGSNIAHTAGISSVSSGKYVDEKIDAPIIKIGDQEEATQRTTQQSSAGANLNFKSASINTDLERYLRDNLSFPDGYVLTFMFSYDKNGTIANISLLSSPASEAGNPDSSWRLYGDDCKRDKLASNQIYVYKNASNPVRSKDLISNTPDGESLVKIYNLMCSMGKTHLVDVPFERWTEFTTVGGMYFGNKLVNFTVY